MKRVPGPGALVLTYHAIEKGPPPLTVEPALFREHLDRIADSGAPALTVAQLAEAMRARRLPERAVVITFDDGAASVARVAAPLLAERGLPATIFCVAGFLGRSSEWPSARPGEHRLELATAAELAGLAAAGFEIGSHGIEHAPLARVDPELARREIVRSRALLEDALGTAVTSFAYPYGSVGASRLVSTTYSAACVGGLLGVGPRTSPYEIPRVDVHYLRRPELLRRALSGGLHPYLGLRAAGARIRRAMRSDHRGS